MYIHNLLIWPKCVEYNGLFDNPVFHESGFFSNAGLNLMSTLVHLLKFEVTLISEYKTDPYSEGDPSKSICMRGDLMTDPVPDGCYDTKVMSH